MQYYADAYAHIGYPRYGDLTSYLENVNRFHIINSVMVLAKTVPDFKSLFEGIQSSSNIRGVGIPFGHTEQQKMEIARIQLNAGVIGLRMEPGEWTGNLQIQRILGEQGKWVFAINPFQSEEIVRSYLEWLESYPNGRIAAPHLLFAADAFEKIKSSATVAELLGHPRFHPIFSRQGGAGSRLEYPHTDFLPWIDFVLNRVDLGRIMWGSEYPVIYSRNESIPGCIAWLHEIDAGLSDAQLQGVLHDNCSRIFFKESPAIDPAVRIPQWVEEQFDYGQTVRIYNTAGFELPLEIYGGLLNGYLRSDELRRGESFAQFFTGQLARLIQTNEKKPY